MMCEECIGFDCDIFCDGRVVFVVDSDRCTECVGNYQSPRCVEVCPVDACVPDTKSAESWEELLAKWCKLHPGERPKVA